MKRVMLMLTLLLAGLQWGLAQQRQHVVQRGETFATIARKYAITEQELMEANSASSVCYVGRKLIIPQHGVPVVQETPTSTEPDIQLTSSPDKKVLTKSAVTAYQTGQALWKKGRYETAMNYLKVAAAAGEARAYYPLGAYYAMDDVACHNNDSALFWLEKVTDKQERPAAQKIIKEINDERKAQAEAQARAQAETQARAKAETEAARKAEQAVQTAQVTTSTPATYTQTATTYTATQADERELKRQRRQERLNNIGNALAAFGEALGTITNTISEVQNVSNGTYQNNTATYNTSSYNTGGSYGNSSTSYGSSNTSSGGYNRHEKTLIEQRCKKCQGSGTCNMSSYVARKNACHGSGLCGYCSGTGWISAGSDRVQCAGCKGSGKCRSCGGTGKCKYCHGTGKT